MNTVLTIFGILLLVTPYILVLKAQEKFKAALTIFTYTTLASVIIALSTQALHVFNYYTVIFLHICIAAYSIYLFRKGDLSSKSNAITATEAVTSTVFSNTSSKNLTQTFSKNSAKKAAFPIAFFLLAIYLLCSVHFNYSGFVDTVLGLKKVTHSSYEYPMYSDEWVGISFIDYSIRTGTLPFANTLNGDTLFPNFLFVSHSLFAEIIVLLNLNVIQSYIYFAMLNALLITLAIYLILRQLNISANISAVAAFSVLLLTNSGNLPGLWSLLPYSASLLFLLFSILARLARIEKASSVNLMISLVVYPPMIVFVAPIWLAYKGLSRRKINGEIGNKSSWKSMAIHWIRIIYIPILACIIFLGFFMSKGFSFYEVYSKVISYIIRPPLDQGRVNYAFWNVIPVYILPFALLGLISVFKQKIKVVAYPLLAGICLWILYCFVDNVYLIEPSRVVVITCVLLIISAGLGMEKFYMYALVKTKGTVFDLNDSIIKFGIKAIVFIFFVFWAMNIGRFGLWHKLPLKFERTIITTKGELQLVSQKLYPTPPVTRYLTDDDLRLFSGFSHKKFISPEWKGLVIGVATRNYPLDSKPSMVTNNILSYEAFSAATCEVKNQYIKKYKIDLVYSASTTCAGFKELGKSSENLYLYKVEYGSSTASRK